MSSVVLLALLPVVAQKRVVIVPSLVWNLANATEDICSVVGSVYHRASVVVSTKVLTFSPKRSSGMTNNARRNVCASQTPRQFFVLSLTARTVRCASF